MVVHTMKRIHGIILKKQLHSSKFWIIAESLGKVELFFKVPTNTLVRLVPGSEISFLSMQKRTSMYAVDVTLIAPPSTRSIEECSWLHHILELYYHFTVPDADDSVFSALQEHLFALSYKHADIAVLHSMNMLCVTDFLVKTGFYTSPALNFYQKCFRYITLQSLQTTLTEQALETLHYIRDYELPRLQKTITNCLQNHPNYAQFNTVPFVYSH
jgi:hypothetical protein